MGTRRHAGTKMSRLDVLYRGPAGGTRTRLVRFLEALRAPHARHLEGKLWELRVRAEGDIARGIYVTATAQQVAVLHVFVKKTRRTPRRALEMAKKRTRRRLTVSEYQYYEFKVPSPPERGDGETQGARPEDGVEAALAPVVTALWAMERARRVLVSRMSGGERVSGRYRGLRLFISHAKADGIAMANSLIGVLQQLKAAGGERVGFDNFYDAQHIESGSVWRSVIKGEASRSMLIALRTEAYEGRYWCRREFLAAERRGLPIVAVDLRKEQYHDSALLPFDVVPSVRVHDGNLIRVVLHSMAAHPRALRAQSMAPEVQVLPHRPSVYSLSGVLQTGMAGRIAYPGPKLRFAGRYRSDRAHLDGDCGVDSEALPGSNDAGVAWSGDLDAQGGDVCSSRTGATHSVRREVREERWDISASRRPVKTGVQNGENLVEKGRGRLFDEPGFPACAINGLDLLRHDVTGQGRRVRHRHMKGNVSRCVGDGAHHGKARMAVEQSVADYQGGTTPSLLPSGLRVEGQDHEIPLLRNVAGHLPEFLSGRRPPVELLRPVLLGHFRHQVLQVIPSPDSRYGFDDDPSPSGGYIDFVTYVNAGFVQQRLRNPKPLAVPPFLNLGQHDPSPVGDIPCIA